jgi:hypothetical protein
MVQNADQATNKPVLALGRDRQHHDRLPKQAALIMKAEKTSQAVMLA